MSANTDEPALENREKSELENGENPESESIGKSEVPKVEVSELESIENSEIEKIENSELVNGGEQETIVSESDPKINDVKETEIGSQDSSSVVEEVKAKPELKKDEGNRTFTMRELLNELKEEESEIMDGDSRTSASPHSRESTQQQQQQQEHNNAAIDLIDSVTGLDEEGRSRQWILTFAAKRYANTIERNPEDYDALYNWALVLQEQNQSEPVRFPTPPNTPNLVQTSRGSGEVAISASNIGEVAHPQQWRSNQVPALAKQSNTNIGEEKLDADDLKPQAQ